MRTKGKLTKLIALLLSAQLILTLIPEAAFAAGPVQETVQDAGIVQPEPEETEIGQNNAAEERGEADAAVEGLRDAGVL